MKFQVIDGGYQEGEWLHDRRNISDEEIEIWNERIRILISEGHTWLKDFLWDIKPKPPLTRVK